MVRDALCGSPLHTLRSYVHLVNAVLLPFYTTVGKAIERASLSILLAALTADGSLTSAAADPTFRGTVLAPTVGGRDVGYRVRVVSTIPNKKPETL